MNTETILTRVNAVMAYCDNAPMAGAMLKDLAADLSADIRVQCAKRQGVGNAAKTLTAILNAQKKRDTRTALHYAWLDDAGRQCVCDGFQAYRLREPLPLEPRPADAQTPLDLAKVFPCDLNDRHAFALPTAADVRAHIKTERAKNGRKAVVLWDFGDDMPAVNAQYLLNALTVLPSASQVYMADGAARYVSPLYIQSGDGEALILPVLTDAKKAAKCAAQDAERAAETSEERAAAELAEQREQAARSLSHLLSEYDQCAAIGRDYAMHANEFAAMSYYAAQLQALSA